jgi:hypothetical protein
VLFNQEFIVQYVVSLRIVSGVVAVLCSCAIVAGQTTSQPVSGPVDLADRIGTAHTAGRYNFTDGDYLNEGADAVLAVGMRVIKVYISQPRLWYKFNCDWPEEPFTSLVDVVKHPHFVELFDKPFTTFMLTAYTPGKDGHYWRGTFTPADVKRERESFYDLTKYLLTRYKGTGKTFVLQNWEGDWALRKHYDLDPKFDAKKEPIANMIGWLNARQDGVDRARKEITDTDVKVYHACEVNRVDIALAGRPSVTNDVLPHTRCDLYSYSAYDLIGKAAVDYEAGKADFLKGLNYLADKAPDSEPFGDKNVYIGEFGWPAVTWPEGPEFSETATTQVLKMVVETGQEWGCPYLIYWQIFDNEARVQDRIPTNDEARGYYLIRPDGTKSEMWHYFHDLLNPAELSKGDRRRCEVQD